MGRTPKAKAGGAQQKRRKKAGGISTSGSSPAHASSSSSSASSTPGHRECEQCGNNLLLDGVAKAWPATKKSVASTGCQICDFVAFRRSQRPCVQCARLSCDHFCEWCGKGFHAKCAKLRNEAVGNPNGFCCHRCEAEQSESHDTDGDKSKSGASEEEDVGSRCGSCRLPFSSTGKESEDVKVVTGFKVNQAVLVDNDEVLYNALITEVDTKGERIKIHFTRWSKSFDDWYAMDDEHINESLACDCCNNWFHIGCLPPIKSSGRWKDSTYVCPRCIDDARAFHNGSRTVLKAKAAYISTSNAIAKATKKTTSPKESEPVHVAVTKTKKPSKAVMIVDEEDEDMEKTKGNDRAYKADGGKSTKSLSKRKQDASEGSESGLQTKKCASEINVKSVAKTVPSSDFAVLVTSKDVAAASKQVAALSESKTSTSSVHVATVEGSVQVKAEVLKAPAVNVNAAAAVNASAMMHASPEHTIKVAAEAHSSPSKAAAAKIGASNKANLSVSNAEKLEKKLKTSEPVAAEQSSRPSSCNSVMSLLNSPSATDTPMTTFKPTVTSLSVLNPVDSQDKSCEAATYPAMAGVPTNFQVYVKMEQNNGTHFLYPRPVSNGKIAPTEHKYVPTTLSKLHKARKAKHGYVGAGGRGLSAFDILREVASQEIDDSVAFVKPKREKRPLHRGLHTSTSKRARMDASPCPLNAAASPGRSIASGISGNPAPPDTNQSPLTRDRIQMNSFVDLHFSIRKEMYLRFCRLEEEGMLTRDSAHVLRSLIYPTSERFQDLKFVYLVNKDLPSVQLTKRLLEAIPYPPTVAKPLATSVSSAPPAPLRSSGGENLAVLPLSMGMFPTGLNCKSSSTAGPSRLNLLPPPPTSTILRSEPLRPDESSRLVSGCIAESQAQAQSQPRKSASPVAAPVSTAMRPEVLLVEQQQLAPMHHPMPATGSVTNQQQQQQQRVLNSR
ncbi:hypothetical protein PsorP6_016181 [Peronosclerospora sorghi]|uniref:Uncharacterized protein n=1 Tax=Peronosclerospora sorghi TaxID=230839 RepID=A0ACC0VRH9_9STRA|nr:hypothetical protein PsorP6_016181 [Peronosclerospora sorghi]